MTSKCEICLAPTESGGRICASPVCELKLKYQEAPNEEPPEAPDQGKLEPGAIDLVIADLNRMHEGRDLEQPGDRISASYALILGAAIHLRRLLWERDDE